MNKDLHRVSKEFIMDETLGYKTIVSLFFYKEEHVNTSHDAAATEEGSANAFALPS